MLKRDCLRGLVILALDNVAGVDEHVSVVYFHRHIVHWPRRRPTSAHSFIVVDAAVAWTMELFRVHVVRRHGASQVRAPPPERHHAVLGVRQIELAGGIDEWLPTYLRNHRGGHAQDLSESAGLVRPEHADREPGHQASIEDDTPQRGVTHEAAAADFL